MSGIEDRTELLRNAAPELDEESWVFCLQAHAAPLAAEAFALIREAEGTTLILTESQARSLGLEFEARFSRITLSVHSSLHAVGLTAAVASRLAQAGIACNVVAGYYHDHLFVPADRGLEALERLELLS